MVSTLDHVTFLLMEPYLSKAGFSVVAVIKRKYRMKIAMGQDLRVVASS